MEQMAQNNREIRKEPNKINLEDLLDYIQPFMHLFNKKKFKKVAREMWMGPQNQLNRQGIKRIECKDLCDDIKRKSSKSIAKWTAQGRIDSGVKIIICSILFLYSKEGQFITISSRLLETQLDDNKGQDITTINWRSHW